MADGFNMNFHPLIIDDSPHGFVNRHGFDSCDFKRFDQHRILKEQQVILFFQFNILLALGLDFYHWNEERDGCRPLHICYLSPKFFG